MKITSLHNVHAFAQIQLKNRKAQTAISEPQSTYYSIWTMTFLVVFVFMSMISMKATAQSPCDVTAPFDGSQNITDDYFIPAGITSITFDAKGGDGGFAEVETFFCTPFGDTFVNDCEGAGGIGASVSATYNVGSGPGQIPQGSTIRAIVGAAGENDYVESCVGVGVCGSGGGGGTAVLLQTPGSTEWQILLVAGGGGGGYTSMAGGVCVWQENGRGGNNATNGSAGEGITGGNGGVGGLGGSASLTISSGGGGGAFSQGGGLSGIGNCPADDFFCGGGEPGFDENFLGVQLNNGGNGGYIFSQTGGDGGYGFGAGGGSFTSGGGGGGYSGGGGGGDASAGGGGGSFVSPLAISQNITPGGSTSNPTNGFISMTCATPPPPSNDLCSEALPLACGDVVTGSTLLASNDDVPATCVTSVGARGIWYIMQGNGGVVNITTCGSDYDTKLNVYSGACGALACITGNDDSSACPGENLLSSVSFESTVGTNYYVYVNGFLSSAGNFTLNVTCDLISECPSDVTLNTDPGEAFATATLVPPTAFNECNVLGNALSFDGQDDFVDLGNIAGTNFGVGNFTIEFWMNTTSIPEALTPIISKRAICNCANFWNVSLNIDGTLLFEAFQNTSCANPIGVLTSNSVNDGAWHHIAITRTLYNSGFPLFEDNANVAIYVDDSLSTSAQYPYLTFLSNADPVQIGRSACSDFSTPLYYEGQLDEVRMWSLARTEAQIVSGMSCELSAQTGLLASYPFNEGIAEGDNSELTSTSDASGNGNHGTLSNFALTGMLSNWVEGNPWSTLVNNAPETFLIGNTPVTWTVSDAMGFASTCVQNITVIDNEEPEITCPEDVVLTTDQGEIFATTTLLPATTTDNSSIFGNALNFDGADDRVTVSNPVSGVFTIEAWIKTSAIGNTGTFAFQGDPILWSDVFGGGNDFTLAILNNKLSFFDGSAEIGTDGTTILNDGVWHHVAVVRNGVAGTTVLYVDGIPDGSGSCNNVPLNGNPGIVIGGNLIDQHHFNGSMDEVRIWSEARTQAEILSNLGRGISAQAGLLASYRFNEGIAGADNTDVTTASDASGNGNDGTLNNFGLTGMVSNWVDNSGIILTNDAPATFPIGTTSVTWTATDPSGNEATCSFDVVVEQENQSLVVLGTVEANFLCFERNATITLYSSETGLFAESISSIVNIDGTFEFSVSTSGTYDVYVRVDGFLRKAIDDVEIANATNNLAVGSILGGDLNNSNSVNIADISVLGASFNSAEGDANFNVLADLNCNGAVNIVDFSLLNISFGLQGVFLPN